MRPASYRSGSGLERGLSRSEAVAERGPGWRGADSAPLPAALRENRECHDEC